MKVEPEHQGRIALPARPKGSHSEKFKNVQLTSNHYKVNFRGARNIYIISAKFEPLISDDNRQLRKRVFQEMDPEIRKVVTDPVYTGMSIMSGSKPSFASQTAIQTRHDGKDYTLQLKLVRCLDFTNGAMTDEQKFMVSNFFNNYLRNKLRELNFIEIGKTRKFFDTSKRTEISGTNLTMFEGYAANFTFLESGLYLKVDAASKIVRGETVLNFIDSLYSIHTDKSKEEKRAAIQEALVGKTIMTNYGNSKCWRIDGVVFDRSMDEIKLEDGSTLLEYYKNKYNVEVRKVKQPLLVAEDKRQKKETLLVPELCLMTGLADDMDDRKRREVSAYTIKPASDRKYKIEALVKRMNKEIKNLSPQYLSDKFGISIEEQLHQVKARQIPFPQLQLGDRNSIEEGKQANFRLFNQPLYNTKVQMKIACLAFRDFNIGSLESIFKSTAKSFQIDMEFKACDLGEFSSRKGLETIEDELRYRAKKGDSYNIYLIVLPNALKTSYKKIKKICLVDLKLVSQIVTQFTLGRKEFNSIATKVLLQMAAKVGNTLWVPKPMESLRGVRIMLVGVDSTADKNSKGKIIGFCASLNESHTKYFSSTIVQDSSSTVLEKMKELMCRSIKAYTDENKYPPNEIVVLRDGCSAGEIRSIRESEVENSLEALKLIDSHISLTYIVIDKKVSQKFFGQYNGNACNPQAGTLVNTDLVSENYDFYLVSQFSMRGTTVPTYYKVIYSDSKLEQGKLQELLYHQCYNYVNWTGSIKIPAPVQYAKKLCSFASQYVSEGVDLDNQLYFI